MGYDIGFKELYEVSLKATYPIEVGGRIVEAGETIAAFDKIQLANFQEIVNNTSANGGYDSRALIYWTETKEVRVNFTQGVFSKLQLALLTNAKLLEKNSSDFIQINKIEHLESDGDGLIHLKKIPSGKIFVYNEKTGEKIDNWSIEQDTIKIGDSFLEVMVDYWYNYTNSYSTLCVGQALTQGYLSLTGKTRVKDDITGQVKTGIINIPKLKLMSDLSMRLGQDAIPQVGRLDAVALPVGARGDKKVMEILFLDEDVDSDM